MKNRNTSPLEQAFTNIANAIRSVDGTETTMTPIQMPQRILTAFDMEETITPSKNLPSIFSCIADSIRTCGIGGTMKVSQMPSMIIKVLEPTLSPDDTFVGQSIYCKCLVRGTPVLASSWQLTSGGEYATINPNGRIDVYDGVHNRQLTIQCSYQGNTVQKTITVSYDNQLNIECLDKLVGTSASIVARYNDEIVVPTWSITSGGEHATISANGTVTILNSGAITIQATYNNYVTTKQVILRHEEGTSSRTIVNDDGSVTGETQVVVVNSDGSTTTNTDSLTTNEDGSTYPSSGVTTTYLDGSVTSTTTKYNLEGDPTEVVNQDIDVDGNTSTQNISYDANGQPVVVGYSIDTSDGTQGYKTFNEEGVNTGFYGFDTVEGFVMNIHFTIDFTAQPPDQDEGIHQIVAMKRANPSPWYGFQLRQTTEKCVQTGTQFATGGNTNTKIYPTHDNWIINGKVAEYNIQVTYDPLETVDNTFVCRELISGTEV